MDEIEPFMEALLGLKEPWTLTGIEADLEAGQVDLYIDFLPGSRWPCPECGKVGCPVHDTLERTWRHMNLFQYKAYVHARVPRVKCPDHGVRQVKVPWSREGSGHAGTGSSPDPGRMGHSNLEEGQDLFGLISVGIDETSWKRHHRYLTVFVDLHSKRVVFDPTLQRPPGGAEQPVPGGKGKSQGKSKPQVRHPGFLPRRRSF